MSIRLNKAIQELNIGVQTAIDYLRKHKLLDVENPGPTLKLSDEQYDALLAEFQPDKEARKEVKKIIQKKAKEKSAPAHAKVETPVQQEKPQFKPVGKRALRKSGSMA